MTQFTRMSICVCVCVVMPVSSTNSPQFWNNVCLVNNSPIPVACYSTWCYKRFRTDQMVLKWWRQSNTIYLLSRYCLSYFCHVQWYDVL